MDAEDIAHLTGVKSNGQVRPRLDFGRYTFKCAETEDELRQVHRLNYRTFVREIGQYPDEGTGYLVDKFHDKNRYFIALRDGQVVAMIAGHDKPPFSAAERLEDKSKLRQLGDRLIELRLLAIEPSERHGPVFRGLLWLVYEYGLAHGYTHLIISGITDRQRLYERMGFRALGPAVPCGEATFVPMAMSLDRVPGNIQRDAERVRARVVAQIAERPAPVSLLPGPVQTSDEIRQAVSQRPESHRGDAFIERYERIRSTLGEMVGGLKTAIMVGSGTLANEVVGATIAADGSMKRGLVLVNGEFGRRLGAQACRHHLDCDTIEWPWGEPWRLDEVRAKLDADDQINWIWAAHLETSTGMMNDIEGLLDLATERGVRVCLDCVSSLGAAAFDISRAHLASGVSGKSVGALAGLAFIFARDGALEGVDSSRMPMYLDLPEAMKTVGPRFTVSSPLLAALDTAMRHFSTPELRSERYEHYRQLGEYARRRLAALGLTPLVDGDAAAPVITSFRPPAEMTSAEFCDLCLSWGFEISGLSGYLLDRNLVQVATMGAVTQRDCAQLFARLRTWLMDRELAATG